MHAPKIIALENEEWKQIFGWETDAAGEEYADFLKQFLSKLLEYIKLNCLEKRSYFHISDEPHTEHLEWYQRASELVREYLGEFPIIDALSNYQFYEKGLIKNPIPSSYHVHTFIDHQVPELWTYYCNWQHKEVSNRFFNMPSARNRILGLQLYKFNIKGFLHWGYNFWYSQYSRKPINPYQVTDSDLAFPSGDAFLVYPGEQGPVESLRLKVLNDAMQDLRALQLLEKRIGREQVLDLLEEGLDSEITFSQYPRSTDWLLDTREQINQRIKSQL